MKKSIFIMMMGLFALIGNSFAQIKLWNNGGIAIGDTTDPGSEKTVFYDDVEFTGDVTGIIGGSENLFDNGTSSYFTGQLGISTTGPTSNLQVDGTLASPANVRISNLGGTWSPQQVIGQFSFHTTDASGVGARDLAVIKGITATGGTTLGGELAFFTSVHNSTTLNEVMRLDDAGYVGIGTTTPAYPLDIQIPNANDRGLVIRDEDGDIRSSFTLSGTSGVREGRIKLYDWQGNEDVRIHSGSDSWFNGGNVGIGFSSPGTKLDVSGTVRSITTSGTAGVVSSVSSQSGNGGILRLANSHTSQSIGATSGEIEFYKADGSTDGAGVASIIKSVAIDNGGTYNLHLITGSSVESGASWNGQFCFDYRDRLGIGTLTPAYNLDVQGTGRFTGALTASTLSLSGTMTLTNGLNVSGAGTFNNGLTAYQFLTIYGTFNNMSDRTLKTDINILDIGSLGKITSLQGVTYRFINDEKNTKFTGFIAQDVQKVFPELVSELDEGLAIKTLELIPHLVEAIKEQQGIIEEQQGIIADLDARLKALEGK